MATAEPSRPTQEPRTPSPERIEEVARSLNDDWAAGPYGAGWQALDEVEREHWRRVARVHLSQPDLLVPVAVGEDLAQALRGVLDPGLGYKGSSAVLRVRRDSALRAAARALARFDACKDQHG